MSPVLLAWEVGFRGAASWQDVDEVQQLPQTSTFGDPARERGRVCVPSEKNIREASTQELSKSRAQTAPFLQHLCGSWLLGAGSSVAKQLEPGGLKPIS